jgi:hypothetical protein
MIGRCRVVVRGGVEGGSDADLMMVGGGRRGEKGDLGWKRWMSMRWGFEGWE